jgi:hypothetical protein
MPGDETPGPTRSVKPGENLTAAALAGHFGIRFPGHTKIVAVLAVMDIVFVVACQDLEIGGVIVHPVVVDMVDDLAGEQSAADLLLGDHAMFVGAPLGIGEVMALPNPDLDVAV